LIPPTNDPPTAFLLMIRELFVDIFKMPFKTAGYAAYDPKSLAPFQFERRDVGENDVHIEVEFCGICHSDLHSARNEWAHAVYPLVPGHEVAGIVKAVGSKVTKFKVGDKAGVGCFVDSCRTCGECKRDEEQLCLKHVQTYNQKGYDGKNTYGGYSRDIVVDEKFVLKMPTNVPLDAAAPLLCAGITTYSAIKAYDMHKPGKTIGVIGLGGLGHVAVMILKAMGQKVAVISRSNSKKADAMKLGADIYIASEDPEQIKNAFESLDGLVDTVSAPKDWDLYLSLIKCDCKIATVGVPPVNSKVGINWNSLIMRRKAVGGSLVGGIKETQEMLDFCDNHKITPWIEVISMDKVNEAYERLAKADVKYRFVLDVRRTAPKIE